MKGHKDMSKADKVTWPIDKRYPSPCYHADIAGHKMTVWRANVAFWGVSYGAAGGALDCEQWQT